MLVKRIFSAIERTYRLKTENEGQSLNPACDRFSRALSSLRFFKPLKLSSWKTFRWESPQRCLARASDHRERVREKERTSRPGSSIRQLDVPCQISEKVVAFCPAGGTASRNTLQSCKGRWDLRDILQRLPAPRNSSSYIGRFPVADQCDVPRGNVSLPTCSALDTIARKNWIAKVTSTKVI